MSDNAELLARRDKNIPKGVSTSMPFYVERAKNAEVWDVEGKRYVDFAGGIGAMNVGHCHPEVIEAVTKQLNKFTHTCFQVCAYEPYINLVERLNQIAPGPTPKKSVLLTTGCEAVETAIKVARAYTKRNGIIGFGGSFHGRTFMALSVSGKVNPYKMGCGKLPDPVYRVPFPDEFHGITEDYCLRAIHKLFRTDVAPEDIAAIIIEAVQGEGGFRIAPFSFLRELRKICDDYGIVLIVDEIQSGFARTGKMFAIEHSGVEPDLLTLAKSLGAGLPISAVVGKAHVMDSAYPNTLGSTYAGNPLSCQAALTVLDIIEKENLVQRSQIIGERITHALLDIAEKPYGIKMANIHGLGGMVAFECVVDQENREPDVEFPKRLRDKALENGLMILVCGFHYNAIRILVPLNVSEEILEEGLAILDKTFQQLAEN